MCSFTTDYLVKTIRYFLIYLTIRFRLVKLKLFEKGRILNDCNMNLRSTKCCKAYEQFLSRIVFESYRFVIRTLQNDSMVWIL